MKTVLHVMTSVIVAMVSMTLSDVRARCPARCFCQRSTNAVYCSRRGLDAIPDSIPPGTRQLYLNGNHFASSVICRTNFSRFPDVVQMNLTLLPVERISGLERLYLSDCAISNIEAGAFSDLDRLRWLDLSDNQLTALTDATFSGSHLHQLFLNGNRRLSLDDGHPFADATISGLYLHDCQLTSVAASTLEPLIGSLRVLWLSENRLSSLDVSLTHLFSSLDHFRLAGNRLRCDCELSWLWRIVKDRVIDDDHGEGGGQSPTEELECAGPGSVRGRSLSELSDEDVRCRAPSLADVEVTLLDNDDVTLQSSRRRLVLRCTATGDPAPDVYWVSTAPSGEQVRAVTQKTSVDDVSEAVLVLDHEHDVQSTSPEPTAFTCVASNVIGNVTLTVRRISATWEVATDRVQPRYTFNRATASNADDQLIPRNSSSTKLPKTSEHGLLETICRAPLSWSSSSAGKPCGGRDRHLRASVPLDDDGVQQSSRSSQQRGYGMSDLMGAIATTVLLTTVTVVAAVAACLRRRDRSASVSIAVLKHLGRRADGASPQIASATAVVYGTTAHLSEVAGSTL